MRCSSLDQLWACPMSGEPAIRVRGPEQAANMGSAAHWFLARMVDGKDCADTPDLPYMCPGVDATELRVLVAQGRKMWRQLRDDYPAPKTEVSLQSGFCDDFMLTGHVDVISLLGDAHILDWKTSRKDPSYKQQMLGYCWLALCNSEAEKATATIAWIRTGEVERYSMTRDDMTDWAASIAHRICENDGTFYPGPQCEYCPRSHECPAANALARRNVAALLNTTPSQAALDTLTPQQLVDLLQRAKTVGRLADAVQDAIKTRVAVHGPIEVEGARISLEPKERREIRPAKAGPVLEEWGFFGDALSDITSISLARAKCHIADWAPRGAKGKQVKAFEEALEEAGAIETTISQTLTLKRQ